MNLLVSACLLGMRCRYDGAAKPDARVLALAKRHALVPVCPEIYGGLSTPRLPAERVGERVLTAAGVDVTGAYERGAQETLALARVCNCRCAVLKSRSPSCGCTEIYDGSFSGKLCPGEGVTAALLRKAGIRVLSEEDMDIKDALEKE